MASQTPAIRKLSRTVSPKDSPIPIQSNSDIQIYTVFTEEVNPLIVDLESQLSKLEIEVGAGTPRLVQIKDEITSVANQIIEVSKKLQQDKADVENKENEIHAGLEKLHEERKGIRAQLVQERDAQLAILVRQLDQKKAELKHEADINTAQGEREIAQKKELYTVLSTELSAANLTILDNYQDVSVAAPAVASSQPLPRNILIKTVIAMLAGLFLGTALALGAELNALAKAEN